MQCSKCGKKLQNRSKFCSNCGKENAVFISSKKVMYSLENFVLFKKLKNYISERKNRETALMCVVAGVVVLSFVFDIINFPFSNFLSIKYHEKDELFATIYAVQASASTICIAIVALLANSIQEKAYGTSLSRYIMYEKPYYFKHNRVIFANILLILSDYVLLSMQLYNTLLAFFLTSILLLLFMIKDVVRIFTSKDELIEEMKDFALNMAFRNKSIFTGFRNELITAIETNNSLLVKTDFELLVELFANDCSNNSANNLSDLEDICIDALTILPATNSKAMNESILSNVIKLYVIANKKYGNEQRTINLSIFDKSSKYIFRLIVSLDFSQLADTKIIDKFHSELYKNVTFNKAKNRNTPNRDNGFNLHYWSYSLYYAFFVYNRLDLSENDQYTIKRWLFEDVKDLLKFGIYKDERRDILVQEISLYTKAFIDSLDKKAISEFFFVDETFNYLGKSTYINQILIYLYYLASREKSSDEKLDKIKNFSSLMLSENVRICANYLHRYMRNDSYSIKIDFMIIQNQINNWEFMPGKKAKWLVLEDVVNDYFIWSLLNVHFDNSSLYKSINEIIKGYEFKFYDRYIGPNDQQRLINEYRVFNHYFLNEKSSDIKTESQYGRLQIALRQLYKNSIIDQGKSDPITETKVTDFIQSAKIVLDSQISAVFGKFPKIDNESEDTTITKTVSITPIEIDSSYMDSMFISELFVEYFYQGSISILSLIVSDEISLLTIADSADDKLTSFFKEIKIIDRIDTIIGNPNYFYADKEYDNYMKLIQDKFTLFQSFDTNSLVAINSQKLSIAIKDLKIEIVDFPEQEIEDRASLDGEGNYMFNVTNDIFLPFSKSELHDYFHNTRKKMIVSANISYSINHPPIGAGIMIVSG